MIECQLFHLRQCLDLVEIPDQKIAEPVFHGQMCRDHQLQGGLQAIRVLRDAKGPEKEQAVEMESISSRLGRTTVELSGICKAYGDKVLIKEYTYFFLKNDRIG